VTIVAVKPVFDLKASLARPLGYTPHRGKLKPFAVAHIDVKHATKAKSRSVSVHSNLSLGCLLSIVHLALEISVSACTKWPMSWTMDSVSVYNILVSWINVSVLAI